MTYQVFARRWRPRTLQALVGQPFAVRALQHAVDQKRLHHAYLFTGTRGVGKTTLARLIAKCLNCLQGVSSLPCGVCTACQAIDAAQFLDLIEVDAASRTKVEETRELLENVPYLPTVGRYKIYLIDEVHMLSGHSFNALLKTLEEPPAHVIFLLATTDPERLPMTILSRCLRFHLNKISIVDIEAQLQHILGKEKISFEPAALRPIALAAQGSLRDALSLLEQAVNAGAGRVTVFTVTEMLGLLSVAAQEALCQALAERELVQLFKVAEQLDHQGVQAETVLEMLQECFHQASLLQLVPDATQFIEDPKPGALLFSQHFSAEELQVLYQITLLGRRDLTLALTSRQGLEMLLLRLYTFVPGTPSAAMPGKALQARPAWEELVAALPLTGLNKQLAEHCVLERWEGQRLALSIDPAQALLLNKERQAQLAGMISEHLGQSIQLVITLQNTSVPSPAAKKQAALNDQKQVLTTALKEDAVLQALVHTFDASVERIELKPKAQEEDRS